ncbi:MAG: hypothetical protein QM535_19695 [Limnohabitans sp.]|nr:hypothetical protein [Limnohabitans sp.]
MKIGKIKLRKNIIYILIMINCNIALSQNLDYIRTKYCIKKYRPLFTKILNDSKKNNPPGIFKETKTNKMFNIPTNIRLGLFPFKEFDSVFIATPKHQENIDVTYFVKEESYLKKQLLTKEQKNYVSDIIYNYYRNKNQGVVKVESVTCNDKLDEAFLVLLFKNKNELKYIALNKNGYSIDNFSDEESFELDVDKFKVNKIFQFFNNLF